MLIIAGVLAALVQYMLPSPAPVPAPQAEAPASRRSAEPPPPEAAPPAPAEPAPEPAPQPAAPPEGAGAPPGPAQQMPADALAFPPEPVAPEAPVQQGQAEVDRAEDATGPRAFAILDLNTASVSDLNKLRGGGAIGRAIVAKRPYTSVEQLLSKRVLSRAVYDRIKDQVTVR
ncbi:helix-hairpin-helix domain-containing protein [Methylobacterium sp. NEAU K]|uniref:helix-hairpin-helix domain-containing protein n=1 Tax=Methylobacterium sp. NEAU K TaxID=3064946 RepID=UPI00351E0C6E